jgi:hypothetical protein
MTHIMADMAETMNEVLALVSSLLKEIDGLNVTRDDQDVINTLVAGQIITLDERLRQAMADYDHDKLRRHGSAAWTTT